MPGKHPLATLSRVLTREVDPDVRRGLRDELGRVLN
jgi:hypothetical protein